jgi:hypothetical protein
MLPVVSSQFIAEKYATMAWDCLACFCLAWDCRAWFIFYVYQGGIFVGSPLRFEDHQDSPLPESRLIFAGSQRRIFEWMSCDLREFSTHIIWSPKFLASRLSVASVLCSFHRCS